MGTGWRNAIKKTGMKIYDFLDIRDMVSTSGRATPHMTVDTYKKNYYCFLRDSYPENAKQCFRQRPSLPLGKVIRFILPH